MRIYVGGSLRNVTNPDQCRHFVAALGRTIVSRGHVLLNGCRNPIDKDISDAAMDWLVANKREPKKFLISYWQRDIPPVHSNGTLRMSALADWTMSHPELRVPEQIANAHVTIFLGGGDGTFLARNWALWASKPIIGIPIFGGAGNEIYLQTLHRCSELNRFTAQQYEEHLNQLTDDIDRYAHDVVILAEQLVLPPKNVFVIMSFQNEADDAWDVYQKICKKHGFRADRTDKTVSQERIIPRIEKGIATSAFVIADISNESSNVYFEVGFARGQRKAAIFTARTGTKLPFDVNDVPILFWTNLDVLKSGLDERIKQLKEDLRADDEDLQD